MRLKHLSCRRERLQHANVFFVPDVAGDVTRRWLSGVSDLNPKRTPVFVSNGYWLLGFESHLTPTSLQLSRSAGMIEHNNVSRLGIGPGCTWDQWRLPKQFNRRKTPAVLLSNLLPKLRE
jgi:hypothetical protein